jgi:GNAT superfamily N-acetyltransferase
MDNDTILQLFDREQRQDVEFPNLRREAGPNLVRYVTEAGYESSFVLYAKLNEANVAEAIESQIAYFERLGQDFEWKVYDHDTPPDLLERLRARGFTVEETEAVVVLDMEAGSSLLRHAISPAVQRITEPARIADVMIVKDAVWGHSSATLGERLAHDLVERPDILSVFVAYVDGQPASAAWIYYHPGSQFASLWGGSTRPEYRGRGLYTALVAARAQEARPRGVRFLTVDASPMSRPILEKLGFQTISYTHPCRWYVQASRSQATGGEEEGDSKPP